MALHATREIVSQPDCWRRAADVAARHAALLPAPGEKVAAIGCGTSWFMAQAYSGLRESRGHGITDAFATSELPAGRTYDKIVAITRSGTTTEVLRALEALSDVPTVVITADGAQPAAKLADGAVVLDFADEQSVVQTRFATSTLALLRAHLGEQLDAAIADAATAVTEPLPDDVRDKSQFTFLGTGWTVGLANEAALKMREASLSWTESYPAMEYRHGPMSITDESSVVWIFGPPPPGLVDEIRGLGATVVSRPERDPMAELIGAQRLAIELGVGKGLNPDQPRHLSRAVLLDPGAATTSPADSGGDSGDGSDDSWDKGASS